jgi:glycosyltransferase involved in cell wall biosynthesis
LRILFVADAASIHTQKWLKHFQSRGDEVHVASFRPSKIEGVTVHLLPTWGMGKLGYFSALKILPTLYKKIKPEVVHAHYVTSYGFLSALTKLHPLIVTAWGSDVLLAPQQSIFRNYFARYALKHADHVTTLAEHMNGAVSALGVPLTKLTATPFGVNIGFFKPSTAGDMAAHPVRLVSTRNFHSVYDIKTLILALAEVSTAGYSLDVDLIGDGPLRHELEALVKQLQLDKYITFRGYVDQETLKNFLVKSDIFVTSALSDGNSVSLAEAFACGCFPIATDIPANTQWITQGLNGYIYPAGDVNSLAQRIMNSLNGSAMRQSAKTENRRIAEEHLDWNICASRMEKIYEQVIAKTVSANSASAS